MFNRSIIDSWISKYITFETLINLLQAYQEYITPLITREPNEEFLYVDSILPTSGSSPPVNLNILSLIGYNHAISYTEISYAYSKWLDVNLASGRNHSVRLLISQINLNKKFDLIIEFWGPLETTSKLTYIVDEYYVVILIIKLLYNGWNGLFLHTYVRF